MTIVGIITTYLVGVGILGYLALGFLYGLLDLIYGSRKLHRAISFLFIWPIWVLYYRYRRHKWLEENAADMDADNDSV